MAFRLLLFDLDDTLLTSERRIHPRNLAVLKRLMGEGVRVSLATGRSPLCAEPHARLLGPNAPLIHFNGAMLRDWRTGEVLRHRRLPLPDALAALRVGARLGLHANLYLGDEILIAERTPVSGESERKDGVPHTVVGRLEPHLARTGRDPTKILFIGDPLLLPGLVEALREEMEHDCALVNSEPTYLEMLPVGVNKGSAAVELAARLGLSMDQVMAFGDNKNDAEMLARSGLGVAMGNSHPALRPFADALIGDHDGDAIAVFLEERFAL